MSLDIDRLLDIAAALGASGVNWETHDLDRQAAAAALSAATHGKWVA